MDEMGDNICTSNSWKTLKAILAEFLGTALFVFIGVASCLNWTHTTDHDQLIRIGLTIGLGLAGIIYVSLMLACNLLLYVLIKSKIHFNLNRHLDQLAGVISIPL